SAGRSRSSLSKAGHSLLLRSFHQKQDDILHRGPLQRPARRHQRPLHQAPDAAEAAVLPGYHGPVLKAVHLICRAHEDAILLQQPILLVAEQQPPLVEEGDIVAQLFQVAQNVGGDQDGVVLLPGELVEDLQHLVPDDGVQAGSGLVQHQQPGAVAQGHGDGQLHLHATGEVLEGLFLRQAEAGEVILVLLSVPTAVGLGHDASHLKGIQA
ncbi:2-hydroxy-6-oxo-6-phenylhexa-2,4-dienoate hydrolase, partial [Dysosmobacter welbionis]